MVTLIVPLGGLGSRFKKHGYKLPKPLINVFGKPILFWLFDNISINKFSRILIPYHRILEDYDFEDNLRKKYSNIEFKFLKLDEDTEGASHSILFSLELLNKIELNEPVLCLDGDNFYIDVDIFSLWNRENSIICYRDTTQDSSFSFIQLENDKSNLIKDIVEKERISDLACCGGYGFESGYFLKNFIKITMFKQLKQKSEYYTSSVIREMIKSNFKFNAKIIPQESFICLGTPLHVRFFTNNYPAHRIESKKFCFDLDQTLVTLPEIKGDYSTVKPIQKNINLVKYLKNLGQTIIIHTARRMKTHESNQGKMLADIGKITFDTLYKFGIPFDEIYFGKPYADFYIDDKAISSYSDIEKELGFYQNSIEPRSFNNLNSKTINLYRKESIKSLNGEIYYYNNIPSELKDLFPILFQCDHLNNKWYEIEKIDGITASILYINKELNEDNLNKIFHAIHRIHTSQISIEFSKINIYENYSTKLQKRYNSYNYSKFKDSKELYQIIFKKLKFYEEENMGLLGRIHGDTVMTNIMFNKFNKVKLIDMRGQIGEHLTCLGDIFYDWAKLYQSIIGYDEILLNKKIPSHYVQKTVGIFQDFFLKYYSKEQLERVKLLTQSLLFSLIPLHDNENCIKFYELIKSDYLQVDE